MGGRPRSSRERVSRMWKGRRPMSEEFGFFLLLLSNGLLIGLMYSLIALGFVLVYKATDAVNFAQGEFVMIAGLVVALAISAAGAPLWSAVIVGLPGVMVLGFASSGWCCAS